MKADKASYDYKSELEPIIINIKDFSQIYGLYFVKIYSHPHYNTTIDLFDTEGILGQSYTMDEIKISHNIICHSLYNEIVDIDKKNIKCPLCKGNAKNHQIKEGYIIIANLEICLGLKEIIYELNTALSHCCYRGKRNNIRENILKAIISIDNLLLNNKLQIR